MGGLRVMVGNIEEKAEETRMIYRDVCVYTSKRERESVAAYITHVLLTESVDRFPRTLLANFHSTTGQSLHPANPAFRANPTPT